MSRAVPAAVLLLVLCCAPTQGWAKVHEIVWDIPQDGLQLPSISTAKCGDTIRFRCPEHVTHGIFKLEEGNYNGTCPQTFDQPKIGEALSAPKKGCDYSITLTDGPDFFLTSQVPGACHNNLKVYVHAVCIKSEGTFASSLLSHLPALPSLRASLTPAMPTDPVGLPAAAYVGGLGGMSMATQPVGDLMADGQQASFGSAAPRRHHAAAAGTVPGSAGGPAVLEQAKQSAAADVQTAGSKVAGFVLAAAALALVL